MDTRHMYEQLMLEFYFNKMKYLRNQWRGQTSEQYLGIASLIDIGGDDYRQYESIMQGCESIVFEMLADVVKALIEEYKIPVKYYDLRTSSVDSYYVGQDKHWLDYIDQHEEKEVLAFSRTDKYKDVLYIFKQFGIGKRIPQKTLDEVMKATQLTKQCYISYVENDAFSEIINHNNNTNDPTRGTGIFSFKQFIEGLFGKDEYSLFKQYADQFASKVKEYFGFSLVRTLKPNAILNFKKFVRDEINKIDAEKLGVISSIEESQRTVIENHFFMDRNYELLLGKSDFAKSYMTAEWLFFSLKDAGNVDLTAIAMGYFKSIEQLLFNYLCLHTYEKDGISRKVYVGAGKPFADIYGNADLTDALVTDKEKAKYLTLGSLTGFFGYHDLGSGRWYKRNQVLLAAEINDKTYEFIIDTLGSISDLRNGYFHKENLEDWEDVRKARETAQRVFYLLLGAYALSDADKDQLGLIRVDEHDDYYKLCAYINRKAYAPQSLELPIFYITDSTDPYSFFGFAYHDDHIEYDNYGEPVYSGVYLKKFGDNPSIMKITKSYLPQTIWEGALIISKDTPITIQPTGPKKQIFCKGKFIPEDES